MSQSTATKRPGLHAMAKKTNSALTDAEKAVIKALINAGERSQDVHALVNIGRDASVNFGRIAAVKKSSTIVPATDDEVLLYRTKKQKFDQITGLCQFDDERLVRAREAMILAVELFNTPRIAFKAGVFAVLSNIAWTYLLHEFYSRKNVPIVDADGWSLPLSAMLNRTDCPLPQAVRKNLLAIKSVRDVVEHHTIGPFDKKWVPLFQASCLNFEKHITALFGERVSLGHDLGFALQFAKLSIQEISLLQAYKLPEHLEALDARLAADLTEGQDSSLEYQFKVVYTLQSASKGSAHFQFVQPESTEGKEITNVLLKYKTADEMYPHRPAGVIDLVAAALPDRGFTSDKHQKAWKFFKVRPATKAAKPDVTDRRYCIYHRAHKDYTYSDDWVSLLISSLSDDKTWEKLRAKK